VVLGERLCNGSQGQAGDLGECPGYVRIRRQEGRACGIPHQSNRLPWPTLNTHVNATARIESRRRSSESITLDQIVRNRPMMDSSHGRTRVGLASPIARSTNAGQSQQRENHACL
jgi:hypothetical protein